MVKKGQNARPEITLVCIECEERSHITRKNRHNDPDRIEPKKYCPRCRTHRVHHETR